MNDENALRGAFLVYCPHMQTLKLVLAGLPVFLALDLFWLGVIAKGEYRRGLGALARRGPDGLDVFWPAAAFVYVLALSGIALFVLPLSADPLAALGAGALYGAILYAVYDFTNLATLVGWSLRLSILDSAWGAVVCGAAAAAMKAFELWLA